MRLRLELRLGADMALISCFNHYVNSRSLQVYQNHSVGGWVLERARNSDFFIYYSVILFSAPLKAYYFSIIFHKFHKFVIQIEFIVTESKALVITHNLV